MSQISSAYASDKQASKGRSCNFNIVIDWWCYLPVIINCLITKLEIDNATLECLCVWQGQQHVQALIMVKFLLLFIARIPQEAKLLLFFFTFKFF